MKPFDLEKAKAGAPVCTREGFKARIVCFDANNKRFPLVALIKGSDNSDEYPVCYDKEGNFLDGEKDHPKDSRMVGIKKEGWINIYEALKERCIGAVYNSKETAMRMKINEKMLHTKLRLEQNGRNDMYDYEKMKAEMFEGGNTSKYSKGEVLNEVCGDSWEVMCCIEFMEKLGFLREIHSLGNMTQDRRFVLLN